MMSDSSLSQVIARIVANTVEANKPADYIVGTVTATNPLEIKISNNLILDEDFIDLTRNVTDYEIVISSKSWNTESVSDHSHPISSGSTGGAGSHRHDIKLVRAKATIHNALKVGDKVAMLRKQKGQKFLVIDKVVSENDTE